MSKLGMFDATGRFVKRVAGEVDAGAVNKSSPAVQVAAGGSKRMSYDEFLKEQGLTPRAEGLPNMPPPVAGPPITPPPPPDHLLTSSQRAQRRQLAYQVQTGTDAVGPRASVAPRNLKDEVFDPAKVQSDPNPILMREAEAKAAKRKAQADSVAIASESAKATSRRRVPLNDGSGRRRRVSDEQVDEFTAAVYGKLRDQDADEMIAAYDKAEEARTPFQRLFGRNKPEELDFDAMEGSVIRGFEGRPVYNTTPNKEGKITGELLSGDVELHQRYVDAGTDSRARHGPLAHLTGSQRDEAVDYEVEFLRNLGKKGAPNQKSNGAINEVPSNKAGAGDVTPGDKGYAGFSGAFERHAAGAAIGAGMGMMSEGEVSAGGAARGAMFGVAGGKAARMFTGSMRGGAINSMTRGVGDTLSAAGEGTMRKTAGDYISGAMSGFDAAKSQEALRIATFAGAGLAGFSMGRDRNHSRGMNGSRGNRF